MSKIPESDFPLLTRRDLVKFVSDELGIPLTHSSFAKMAMNGQTPPPASYFGKIELYTREVIRPWALATLCTDKPTRRDVRNKTHATGNTPEAA